jgi:hypothetical protein
MALGSLELFSEIDMRVDMAIPMSIMIGLLRETPFMCGETFVFWSSSMFS